MAFTDTSTGKEHKVWRYEEKPPIKVLFMHGLESGPNGRKRRHMAKLPGVSIHAPDMNISMFNINRENCFVRCMLRQTIFRLFLGWVSGSWYLYFTLVGVADTWGSIGMLCLMTFAPLALILKSLIRSSLTEMVTRSLQIQRRAIRDFQPDVVVGSSWGGAMALASLSLGYHACPTLALAPALYKIQRRQGIEGKSFFVGLTPTAASRTIVIHGADDDVVPIADSEMLAASYPGLQLRTVPRGDHQLNCLLRNGPDDNFKSEMEFLIRELSS